MLDRIGSAMCVDLAPWLARPSLSASLTQEETRGTRLARLLQGRRRRNSGPNSERSEARSSVEPAPPMLGWILRRAPRRGPLGPSVGLLPNTPLGMYIS